MASKLVEAACKTKGIDPARVVMYAFYPAISPTDILLSLNTDEIIRVELSALPGELFEPETGPLPESDTSNRPAPVHATLTEPRPATLGSTRRGAKAKRK